MGYVFKGPVEAKTKLTAGPRPAHWAKPGPKPKPLAPFNPELCGTMYGYRQHRRHGMEQCQPCKDENNIKSAERKARQKRAA